MDFRAQISEEKNRLAQQQRQAQKRKSEIESQLSDLAGELQGIDAELAAIEAYEKAIGDIRPSRARASKADAPPARRTRRRRKVSRRAKIQSVIASFGSAGVSRADIILTLNVKGDRSAEQSVSNALAALKKTGAVAHRDGKYFAAPEDPAPEETPASDAAKAGISAQRFLSDDVPTAGHGRSVRLLPEPRIAVLRPHDMPCPVPTRQGSTSVRGSAPTHPLTCPYSGGPPRRRAASSGCHRRTRGPASRAPALKAHAPGIRLGATTDNECPPDSRRRRVFARMPVFRPESEQLEEVSRCQFTLAYDGPAVAEGTMPVVYLAPALSAIGTLFSAANNVLNQEHVRTEAYVRAFSAGSFETLFDVIQSVPPALVAVFAGDAATTVANIKALIFDTGLAKSAGLTGLLRELGGRKPVETRQAETSGNVTVTTTKTTTIEIPSDVLPLYEDPSVRASLTDLVRALDHPGVDELRIRGMRGVECRIHADDREFFGRDAVAEQLLRDERRVAELLVVAPSFNPRQKWRFRDERRPLNATIRDGQFLERVAARQAQFAAGDTMVCRIHTRHVPVASGLRREHAIEQVLEHINRDGERTQL